MNTSINNCRGAWQPWGAASHLWARGARGARGFSLIELMIVVAIIGILAGIAYPAYRKFVLRSHRTDARRVLTVNAQVLQRCYSTNFNYNACLNLALLSPNGYYTVVNTVAASTYSLTATASGAQTTDTQCVTFTIDQTGKQSAADSGGADTTTTCWGGT